MDYAASLNPFSRAVSIYCSKEQFERVAPFQARFGPRMFRKIADNKGAESYRSQLSQEDLLLAVKLEHEIDHLHRMLCCSFGLLMQVEFAKQIEVVFQYIKCRSHDIHLPLDISTDELTPLADSATLSELLTCSRIGGIRLPAPLIQRALFTLDASLSIDDLQLPTCAYSVGHIQRRAPIGAHALIEFLGLSRELSLRKTYGISYSASQSFIRVPQYQLAARAWRTMVGEGSDDSDQFRQPLPSEHYLACDLALWIPYGPDGIIKCPSGRVPRWEDIHPGIRFERIVHLFAETGVLTSASRRLDDDYEAWFRETQNRLCGSLDWPTPDTIGERWLNYFADKNVVSTGGIFLRDNIDFVRGATKLLNLRKRYPAKVAHGHWPAANVRWLWFSAARILHEGSMTIATLDEGKEFVADGYRFPASVSLQAFMELFLEKRTEESMGEELIARYNTEAKAVSSDINNYASRHYGFKVIAGRS